MQSQPAFGAAQKSTLPPPHTPRNFVVRPVALCYAFFLLVFVSGISSALAVGHSANQSDGQVRPERKAVLLLSGAQYGLPVSDTLTTAAVAALREKGLSFSDVYVEMLDLVRNDSAQWRSLLAELLRNKISRANIGVVITQNQAALDFLAQEGYGFVPPHVPVLATLVSTPVVSWRGPPNPVLTITSRWDIEGTIRYGLALFPHARRLIVVGGVDSRQASFFAQTAAVSMSVAKNLELEDTAALPYEKMLKHVSMLPPDTLVLLGTYFKDITGRNFVPADVAAEIARQANAPVFALYDAHIRQGLVGGSAVITETVGRHLGMIAFELLSGERTIGKNNADATVPSQPMFDWAQLQRWGADPELLPSNAIFLHRPRTLWGEYRYPTIAATIAIIALLALSIALAIQNRKRKLAEEATAELNDQLEEQVAIRSAELTARTAELQTIFDCASSGIALIADRKFVRANRRLHEMLGWPYGELIGKSVEIWYINKDAYIDAGKVPYDRIWDGEIHRREEELVRRDGSLVWARMTGTAVDASDRPKGIVSVIEDITNERRVMSQMSQARAQAEAANAAKSSFLANMSHEIRTPLNAIIGLAHLLRKRSQDNDTAEKLERVQASGRHLLRLINDVLDFSKIEAGKLLIVHEPMDVRVIADNVLSILAEGASAKGLQLRIESDPLPCALSGDSMRITQALLNLVGNAIKFTPSGSVTIRTLMEEETEKQIRLRFEVIDTGIGIEPEKLPNLFAPFEQGDASMSKRCGGTGLGLSITQKLAEMMGGQAGATSAVGQGSTFWFTALFDKAEGDSPVRPRLQIKNAFQEIAANFAGRRILLVEDNEINMMVATETLADARLEVEVARDGLEALAVMQAARPSEFSMILMDMQMPNMDGLEATREIRKMPVAQTLPIIAMTANAFNEDRERCFEAGMDDFIAKPVEPDQMFTTILYWLRRGSRAEG
ncbi:MAG: response regulator [Desulfovibrio sp.]|uniref:response regulator n=1 Tax=Desulfovibrio sp. TaxID=885 RepID=UPI00135D7971|nr:response regulator [Desulfovibrio sp.]MTJ91510.1 response regulator [Desulfovibrio sp.]